MNDRELLEMLDSVDRPRAPRPEFEQSLRNELFGTEAEVRGREAAEEILVIELALPDEAAPARRRSTTRRIMLVAVAASLVATVGASVLLARAGQKTEMTLVSKPSVVDACQTFKATAFGPLTRTQLLGDFNSRVFADAPTARTRVETLSHALDRFSSELQSAGIKDAATLITLTEARGFATRALSQIQGGMIRNAADTVKEIGTQLDATQRDLTRLGIASCL